MWRSDPRTKTQIKSFGRLWVTFSNNPAKRKSPRPANRGFFVSNVVGAEGQTLTDTGLPLPVFETDASESWVK